MCQNKRILKKILLITAMVFFMNSGFSPQQFSIYGSAYEEDKEQISEQTQTEEEGEDQEETADSGDSEETEEDSEEEDGETEEDSKEDEDSEESEEDSEEEDGETEEEEEQPIEGYEEITNLLPLPEEVIFPPDFEFPEFDMILPQGYELIAENQVIVTTEDAFKTAILSADITEIYFGADISITKAGGVRINPDKPYLIIDGQDPDTGEIHTFTEYRSSANTDVVYLNEQGNCKEITLQNMIIDGQNHYGTVGIGVSTSGIKTNYINIWYDGPQLIYNRMGEAYIKNLYFDGKGTTLGKASAAGEVGEVSRVTIEGDFHVTQHSSNDNEIFYILATSSNPGFINILPNSDVYINCYSNSGFMYSESINIPFVLGANSNFYFESNQFFIDKNNFTDFIVEDNASMEIKIRNGAYLGIIRAYGDLIVGKGSSLKVYNVLGSNYPVISMFAGGNIYFNDPENVVLYNPRGRMIRVNTTASELEITAQQINTWTSISEGGFQNRPLNRWRKADGEDFVFTGRFNSGDTTKFSQITTNYEYGDWGEEPSPSNFDIYNTCILSVGRLELDAFYRVVSGRSMILGDTKAYAEIRSYYEKDNSVVGEGVYADGSGYYEFVPEIELNEEDPVIVESTLDYLYWEVELFPIEGVLMLDEVPEYIYFDDSAIELENIFLTRSQGITLSVIDTRGRGSSWHMTAKISEYPVSEAGILHSRFLFVNQDNTAEYFYEDNEIQVYNHTTQKDNDVLDIAYSAYQGIFAEVYPDIPIYADIPYYASVQWTLYDTPQ